MAHKHDVYDMESHFEINGSSRFVKETSETKLVVVQGDHNSEVITFKMPRYIDGHDMLLCDKVIVHYINVDTKTNDSSTDIYEVTDLELCEECGDVLTFTWTIEAPATKYAGTLAFVVKFECTEGDSVSYQWNTAKYSGINVLAGLDVSEDFVDKYSSVIKKWFNDMSDELKESATFNVQLQNNNSHYPDYANKTTLSQSDVDERFEIPQDGYIQIIVGRNSAHEGENEHNYVNVSVNINGEYRFAVADSSTGTSFQQSSALYPVRAGDAVATVVETDFTMVTCCFFPLRDFAGDGGLIENAVDKVIGEYMENNDTFAKQSVVNDHMQRTDDELQDINDSIDNLSKDGAGAGGLAAGDEEAAVLHKGGGRADARYVEQRDFVALVDGGGGGEDAHGGGGGW